MTCCPMTRIRRRTPFRLTGSPGGRARRPSDGRGPWRLTGQHVTHKHQGKHPRCYQGKAVKQFVIAEYLGKRIGSAQRIDQVPPKSRSGPLGGPGQTLREEGIATAGVLE